MCQLTKKVLDVEEFLKNEIEDIRNNARTLTKKSDTFIKTNDIDILDLKAKCSDLTMSNYATKKEFNEIASQINIL